MTTDDEEAAKNRGIPKQERKRIKETKPSIGVQTQEIADAWQTWNVAVDRVSMRGLIRKVRTTTSKIVGITRAATADI
jgi:hypothetical protein